MGSLTIDNKMLHTIRTKEITWLKFDDDMPGEILISGNFASISFSSNNMSADQLQHILEKTPDTDKVSHQVSQSTKSISSSNESEANVRENLSNAENIDGTTFNDTDKVMGSFVAHEVVQAEQN